MINIMTISILVHIVKKYKRLRLFYIAIHISRMSAVFIRQASVPINLERIWGDFLSHQICLAPWEIF